MSNDSFRTVDGDSISLGISPILSFILKLSYAKVTSEYQPISLTYRDRDLTYTSSTVFSSLQLQLHTQFPHLPLEEEQRPRYRFLLGIFLFRKTAVNPSADSELILDKS